MLEHYTKAVVLDKEDYGDFDLRVFLYSKDLGRIQAKVKSAKKITSKLAAHLEPGSFVDARVIRRGGFQVVDALSSGFMPRDPKNLSLLRLIKDLTMEEDADMEIWEMLSSGKLTSAEVLRVLGFDPQFAACRTCDVGQPTHFLVRDLEYSCLNCLMRSGRPLNFAL